MLISTSDHRSARRSRKSTSNRPPIFAASPKIAEKPKRQTRWTLFPVAAKNARILGTFSSAAPSIEQLLLPLSSESGQALKIRWTYHPCGFESHHRHHRRTLIWIQLGSFFFAPLPCEKVLILWAFSASRTRIPARAVSSFMLIQSIFDHLQQNTHLDRL